jgi:peptidoglycan/LPS O-acetylase OafA/YrhL
MADPVLELTAAPAGRLRVAADTARVPELDGLRGTAILLVLVCHYAFNSMPKGHVSWWRIPLG